MLPLKFYRNVFSADVKLLTEQNILWKSGYCFWRNAYINYPKTNEFALNLLGSRRNIIHLAPFCQENDSRERQDNRVATWRDIYAMKVESRRWRWFAHRLNFEVESPRVVSVSHNIIYASYSCSVIQSWARSQADLNCSCKIYLLKIRK